MGAVLAVRRGAVGLTDRARAAASGGSAHPTVAGRWRVERRRGSATELFGAPWPDPLVPTVRFLEVTASVLVLGSTQSMAAVDVASAAEAGVDVARRRSGGGAVLVRPGEVVWADVLLPAGDSLWDADVGTATHWLGQLWTLALGDLGVIASWHDGPMVPGPWSGLACFGGLGPGEVTVGGRKAVGISQRRTRAGALFQCAALLGWDPGALVSLFVLDAGEQLQAVAELGAAAGPLAPEKGAVEEAILCRLAKS